MMFIRLRRIWGIVVFLQVVVCILISGITHFSEGATLKDDILLYLPFDGTADADIAKGDGSAVKTENISFEKGKYGEGIFIDKNGYVLYDTDKNIRVEEGTIAFWVNTEWKGTETTEQRFFSMGVEHCKDAFTVLASSITDNGLYFEIYAPNMNDRVFTSQLIRSWKNRTWYHIAVTWSKSMLVLYKDGEKLSSVELQKPLNFTLPKTMMVGSLYVNPSYENRVSLNGMLDEFYIFGRALTDKEIDALYRQEPEKLSNTNALPPSRIVAKDGILYLDNKPVFLTGVQTSSSYFLDFAKYGGYNEQEKEIYEKSLTKDIAERFGIDSVEMSIGNKWVDKKLVEYFGGDNIWWNRGLSGNRLYGCPGEDEFIKGLKGMPCVIEYSSGIYKGPAFDSKETDLDSDLWQRGKLFGFLVLCPHNPKSVDILETYWKGGVEACLRNSGNPYCYELYNEAEYWDTCSTSQGLFRESLRKKYDSISNLNEKWQSDFNSFDDISFAETSQQAKVKAQWIETVKFMNDSFIKLFQEGKRAIQDKDKRDNVYFTVQELTPTFIKPICVTSGFDPFKFSKVVDIWAVEGGCTTFGNFYPKKLSEISLSEAVVNIDRAQYEFARNLICSLNRDKPIINNEFYLIRCSLDGTGYRVPTKEEDIITSFWNELIHGVSAAYAFFWTKGGYLFYNFTEAEKVANAGGANGACLLNSYAYPVNSLKGFKDFKAEVEKIKDLVLPRPRLKGEIAFLYSYPTHRMATLDYSVMPDINDAINFDYPALESTRYPLDVILEEQLSEGLQYEYKAIIFPAAYYLYSDTLSYLKEYVKRGGVLILSSGPLKYDEYGNELFSEDFSGIELVDSGRLRLGDDRLVSKDANLKINTLECLIPKSKIQIEKAKVLAEASTDKEPLVTLNQWGKGKVYYINAKFQEQSTLSLLLDSLLRHASISKPFEIKDEKGNLVPVVQANLIDRGEQKLYFFINWHPILPLFINLENYNFSQGPYSVVDPISNELYTTENNKDLWSVPELKKGVPVILKPQERKLILISSSTSFFKDTNFKKVSIGEMKVEFKEKKEEAQKQLKSLSSHEKQGEEKEQKLALENVNKDKCLPIDISQQANMPFFDEIDGDKKGGWPDQGVLMDLRTLPTGKVEFCNIPFIILEGKKNNSCIGLKSTIRPYFPEKAIFIPLEKKVAKIFFLHTAAWAAGGTGFKYVIHYADQTQIDIPITAGQEITDWYSEKEIKNLPKALVAWRGKDNSSRDIYLFCFPWENPHPEKMINTIDVISMNTIIVPCVVAITALLE